MNQYIKVLSCTFYDGTGAVDGQKKVGQQLFCSFLFFFFTAGHATLDGHTVFVHQQYTGKKQFFLR